MTIDSYGCQWCERRFMSETDRFWHNVKDHPTLMMEKYETSLEKGR